VSEPTTRSVMDTGVSLTVTDACVPIKVAHGHVQALLDLGVDYVFVPRLISTNGRAVYCPKFLGLPDMIASAFEDASWLLSPRYDARRGKGELRRVARAIAMAVGASHQEADRALEAARREHRAYRASLLAACPEPVDGIDSGSQSQPLRLAVVGYPYAVQDAYLNLNLLDKLRRMGATVLTADHLPAEAIDAQRHLLPKELFWTFSDETVLAGYHYMSGHADGLVHVTAFGCGPDSVTGKLLEMRAAELGDLPMLSLMIDEHTGEAGLATRIEAFVDMINRQRSQRSAAARAAADQAVADQVAATVSPVQPDKVKRRFVRRRRRVSFPYLGTLPRVFTEVLEQLGNDVIIPSRPNQRTLTLGTALSPEFACIPFKILLGTYVEALEQGADAIVSSGGVGPCRAGLYTMLHEMILRRAGHNVEILTLEPPRLAFGDFVGKVAALNAAGLPLWQVAGLVRRAWHKIQILDQLEQLSHRTRPRETMPGATTAAWAEAQELVYLGKTKADIRAAADAGRRLLQAVPQREDHDPLRVGIVGEIYVVVEPSANQELEEVLGSMGVEPVRSIYMTGWAHESNLFGDPEKRKSFSAEQAAHPYLAEMIGGHGQDSVGNSVLYDRSGFDGVIQLAPFTCIPEIVAKSVLERVCRELDLPVLSLSLDEQTGRAGMLTRLEAFVDLMERKRAGRQPATKGERQ